MKLKLCINAYDIRDSKTFSEVIRGMKLKLSINAYDISLYISCVFIAVAHVFSLLLQLKVSRDL